MPCARHHFGRGSARSRWGVVRNIDLPSVNFSITRHSGWAAPDNALDMLWARLGARREEGSFTRSGADIKATWGSDAPSSIDRDEREEVGRIVILEIVRDVCEQAPELSSDWFAVGASR